MSNFKFNNGDDVVDSVTEYRGIITARSDYITGPNRYDVECLTGGSVNNCTFDEQRLSLAEDA